MQSVFLISDTCNCSSDNKKKSKQHFIDGNPPIIVKILTQTLILKKQSPLLLGEKQLK